MGTKIQRKKQILLICVKNIHCLRAQSGFLFVCNKKRRTFAPVFRTKYKFEQYFTNKIKR